MNWSATAHVLWLVLVFQASLILGQEDVLRAKEAIAGAIDEEQSVHRDSVLIHNYNYIAERYSGSGDSLSLDYIKRIGGLLKTTQWSKADGLYYRALGKYHDRRGDFQEALDAYSHAIEELRAAGDRSGYIAYAGILKAFVLNNNGLPDQCERELEEIRPIAEELDNKNYLAWIIDAFGDHYFYSGFGRQDFDKALAYYLEVEALLPQVSNQMIIADNAHCLSGCYLRLGMEEKALEYRDKALEVARANNIQSVIFAVYSDLADVYQERKEYAESIRYRQLSLDHARKEHWIEMESRAESNLAYTYKLAGDYENALAHFERLQQIEDSLSRFQVQERYAELQTKYESGKKDLEIEKLKADKLTLIRNILLVLFLAGIGFTIYYRRVSRKLGRQNKELLRKHDEIQEALTEGRNLERKRMAIELHDTVNAKIAATKWMLETLQSEDKPEHEQQLITTLIDSVADIYEDVRFLSHNLVPKNLETQSLETLIEELAGKLNNNQKIQFSTAVKGSSVDLPENIKLQLYSAVMELINNILKHSRGSKASVQISYTDGKVHVTVTDDGQGFDPGRDVQGTGLKNVHARIEGMSGVVRIKPVTSGGSEVHLHVPYDPNLVQQDDQAVSETG